MRKLTEAHSWIFHNTLLLRVVQFSLCLSGISIFVWAFIDLRFREAQGFLNGEFCLPVAVGTALMVVGWTLSGRLKRPAFWFALALVGQAVVLQMIDAGPHGKYQHYRVRPFYSLFTEIYPLLLLYLVGQTGLVFAGLRRRWPQIRAWLGSTFTLWQLLGIGLVFLLTSATLSRHLSIYITELIFAAFVQAISLGNVVLMVWALPEEALSWLGQRFEGLFGLSGKKDEGEVSGLDRFALLAAVWVLVIAALLNVFVYERHPHIPDEVSYIYQARYFAEGMLTLPAPPVPDAFNTFLMDHERGRWYSVQLPGWPAILALGVLLGIPWLVNPALAGLNVMLAYIFIQHIYDRRTARISILLLCVSPWYIFMAMNFMGHTFTLTCALIAAVAVNKARRTDRAIWGWIGGFFLGMMSLLRPLEALTLAALLGLWAAGFGSKRLKHTAIAGLVLGTIVVGSVGLFYNKVITGHPNTFPFMAYTDKNFGPGSNALGFGPERGAAFGWRTLDPLPGHGPIDVLINIALNTNSVNFELFGWSTGSLILIAVVLFSGAMKKNDYSMLTVICFIIAAHTFYWFSGGPDFGARYWYLIIVPCAALTVSGVQHLINKMNFGANALPNTGTRVIVGVLALCLLAFVNYFPWRALDKYYHYRGFRPDIRKLAAEYDFGKSLVLIRGNNYNEYPSAAVYNPVHLKDDGPVYAWDKDEEIRAKLLRTYSDRSVWLVNGPSITKRGFEVAGGPLPAQILLSRENSESYEKHTEHLR